MAAANLVRFLLHEVEFENVDLSEATLGGVHTGGSITGNVVLPDEYSLVNGFILGPHVSVWSTYMDETFESYMDETFESSNLDDVTLEGMDLSGINMNSDFWAGAFT